MAIRLATQTRNAMVNAWGALANGGSVEIRTGAQPASAADAASGTLLATITLAADAYPDAAGGTAAVSGTPLSSEAVAGGTAGWGRVKDSGGGTVFDGTVGTSGADFTITNDAILTGDIVRITGGALTMPAGA